LGQAAIPSTLKAARRARESTGDSFEARCQRDSVNAEGSEEGERAKTNQGLRVSVNAVKQRGGRK